MKSYDLVVVGGGAAGMMASISAKKHHPNFKVALLDRTFALGRKILVCGAGRCNITNINLQAGVEGHYYGADTSFVRPVFSQFGYADIVEYFEDLGVELYVERKTTVGKLFPITDQAKTITAMLEDELERLGVEVMLNTEVKSIVSNNGSFTIGISNESPITELSSQYVILAAGGMTYPALGSNGSGYNLAEQLGHKLVTPVPSALPLEGKNDLSQELQGIKLEAEVTSIIAGKVVKSRVDDVMFTKYGLSGPAVLNISREVSLRINREQKHDVEIKLNLFPGKSSDDVKDLLSKRWRKRSEQTIEKSLYGLFPNKIAPVILKLININSTKLVKALSADEVEKLVEILSDYRIKISATRGWNEAEFTAGGVDTTELKPNTLESKLHKGLYLCGEILDVDGDVGGFNLSWAWVSGFVSGKLS